MYLAPPSAGMPSSTPSSSGSAALADAIAKIFSKLQSFLNCLLLSTLHDESINGTLPPTFGSMTPRSGRMKYSFPSAGHTKLYPCSIHRTPTDSTAGVSSRMYGVNGLCRASTFTSAAASARMEPFAVARQIGVSLVRRFVAFAVLSMPSLMRRSCSLPVSTNQTHPSFDAGVATVGKWVLLTFLGRINVSYHLPHHCIWSGTWAADRNWKAWWPPAVGGQWPSRDGQPTCQALALTPM